ncbi:Protein CBG18487 [Caenorhabditis briggsae]|uniref:Protein CBG18487 n=1 Tax=Caenorhabditis briggsae TaxID=6238 RepID=A8XTF1_CAEBR|nr:Protein CBG18487 [Caenorhabditis briggsae]CAP35928.2 Protein CBG18487 [Caenorhabditis briggsae]
MTENPQIKTKFKSLDDLIELRWYCILILIMAETTAFISMANVTLMVFAGATPTVIGCDNTTISDCHEFESFKNASKCSNPVLEYQFESVQVEFNYICDKAKMVKNTITVQTFGIVVGAAIFGQISDSFGRRKTLIISSMGSALFNLIASYSSNLFYFALWRFFSGIFAGGVSVVQMVYLIENVPRYHRMWIQNTFTWSPNYIIFAYFAWLAQDWRTLLIVVSAASALSVLVLLLLEESPRWLVQKGKIEEARRLFIKIRKIDRLYSEDFEKDLDEVLRIEAEKEEDAKMTKNTHLFICAAHGKCWDKQPLFCICSSMTMYALLFNMEKLSGSIYWNGAIIGATRWIINITVSLADYKLQWFGRKMSVTLSTVITLICLSGIIVFMKTGNVLSIGTNLIISMCAQLFLSKYLIVNELYPTAVRNLAMSAVSTMCRVGAMFSPQLFYLSDIAEWIPYAVLIGFQFVDLLIFSLFIPETKGVHLENHLPSKHGRIFGKSD